MDATHPNYGLTKSKEEKQSEDQPINPLPRAVLRSNTYILLDGTWNFALDSEDKGLEERWFLGHQYSYTGDWPGSIEDHMLNAKIEPSKPTWKDEIVAWYEREFPMPEIPLNHGAPPSLIQLTFGACGYETMVWLNGKLLRTIEGEELHTGEYTSFSYELDQESLKPVNRLTVRIADTMNADIPRGKQESHVY